MMFLHEWLIYGLGVTNTSFFYASGVFFGLFVIYKFKVLPIILLHRLLAFIIIYDFQNTIFELILLSCLAIVLYLVLALIWRNIIIQDQSKLISSKMVFFSVIFIFGVNLFWTILGSFGDYKLHFLQIVIFGVLHRYFGLIVSSPVVFYLYNLINTDKKILLAKYLTPSKQGDNLLKILLISCTLGGIITIIHILYFPQDTHIILLGLVPIIFIATRSHFKDVIFYNFFTSISIALLYVILPPKLDIIGRLELSFDLILIYTINLILGYSYTSIKLKQMEKEITELQLYHFQKSEALGRMAGGIAHEINNYLQIIQGYIEILSLEQLKDNQKNYLMKIQTTLQRSNKLMSDMLVISGKTIPHRENVNLSKLIDENIDIYEILLGDNFHLNTKLQKIPRIVLDPNQIEQVIINLLSNAKNAMPQGGKICLETEFVTLEKDIENGFFLIPEGEYVKFSIQDEGSGIGIKNISQIFEPFFSTQTSDFGSGLGLSIVNSIIEAHNAKINVTTQINFGTTFEIYFPYNGNNVESKYLPNKTTMDILHVDQGINKLLIIDDERDLVDMVRTLLDSFDIEIKVFNKVDKLISYVKNSPNNVDLVISDIVMQDASGFELRTAIQNLGLEIPFLFITGYPIDELSTSNSFHDGENILNKPFSKNQLIAMINIAVKDSNVRSG